MLSLVDILIYVCCASLVMAVALYIFVKRVRMCTNTNSLQGKTILITGGSSGIGLNAAKEFARRGARLLLPCRDQVKARAAIADIIKDTGNEDIKLYKLDTSSLQSVEDFAEELTSSKGIQIDILCLNAGCNASPKRQESVDGFEYTFATNHLGHFHLTNLIRPLLAPSARIIITSSLVHIVARLNFSDVQLQKRYQQDLAYTRSKLMNIYHMHELSARLSPHRITVNAFHPGLVKTPIFKETSLKDWIVSRIVVPTLGITPWEGAQTLIYLATCDKLEGVTGQYFSECKPRWLLNAAGDKKASRKLWEYCEEIITDWKKKRFSTINNGNWSKRK